MSGRRLALWSASLAFVAGCAGTTAALPRPRTGAEAPEGDARKATAELARAEEDAVAWLSVADPRLAARTGVVAGQALLDRLGTGAVLDEDTSLRRLEGSVDVFSFRARQRALGNASAALEGLPRAALPEAGPLGSGVARPRLERELLLRLVAEERARGEEEAKLGEAAGDLVRAVVTTWTPPVRPRDVPERDAWLAARLGDLRDSLRAPGPRSGPLDLDQALYPLERLLAPQQYPRGAAAIAELRMALDADRRPPPALPSAERVARAVQVHLGLSLDPASLPARLRRLEARMREVASAELEALDPEAREKARGRARDLLFVEGACAPVTDSRVRSMGPPPERAGVCGALRALSDEATRAAAVVALHDDVLLALSAVEASPPPRSGLLSGPAPEDADALRRTARERPALALGTALAAEVLYGSGRGAARLAAWRALGEAPRRRHPGARRRGVTRGRATASRPRAAPRPACRPPCTSAPAPSRSGRRSRRSCRRS